MKFPVYFDYASTTPVDYRVVKKMIRCLTIKGIFGNASSKLHKYGWEAEELVDIARNQVASVLKATPLEIIFTSGATESNNLAIKGMAQARKNIGKHIITSVIEHKTVINVCKYLEYNGFQVTWLKPDKNGIIQPKNLRLAIRKNTILVSLMHVNNETGVIQDIKSFGKICKDHNIILHVDAAQSFGKLPINLKKINIDLMSFSSHKLYGPKGIGGLFIKKRLISEIKPQVHGGNQEINIRPGTLAVHQIVGMGEACNIAMLESKNEMLRLKDIDEKLIKELLKIKSILINGSIKQRIPTILNISFCNIKKNVLLSKLKNFAVSNGSACNSYKLNSSHVLHAMGINNHIAFNSIRISTGKFTTNKEIKYLIKEIKTISKINK